MGAGLVALQSIWSLKKGTRTFNIRSNEFFPDILGSLGRYDHPWEEKNLKNKHQQSYHHKLFEKKEEKQPKAYRKLRNSRT